MRSTSIKVSILIFLIIAISVNFISSQGHTPLFTQAGGSYTINLHDLDKTDNDPLLYKEWLPLLFQVIGFGLVFFASHRQIKNAELNLLKTLRKDKAKDLIKDISELVEEVGLQSSLPEAKVKFQSGSPISSKHLLLQTKILLQLDQTNTVQKQLSEKLIEYTLKIGNIKIHDWKEDIIIISSKVIQTL